MSSRAQWTGQEEAVIRRHFPSGGVEACMPHLPGRSKRAITAHAYRVLGLQRYAYEVLPNGKRRIVHPGPFGLSPREIATLVSLSSGRGAKGVATDLFVSVNTARDYMKSVIRKTSARNQVQAVLFAERAGILREHDPNYPQPITK